MVNVIHDNPYLKCPNCGNALDRGLVIMLSYFQGVCDRCSSCGTEIDWWDVILTSLEDTFPAITLAPIGARMTIITTDIRANEFYGLLMTEYGVPEDALVLSVHCSASNGVMPTVLGIYDITKRKVPTSLPFYTIPIAKETFEGPTTLVVTWVPKSEDVVWQNLIYAFESYCAGEYKSAVVPANVAVESLLSQLLSEFLERIVSRQRVGDFLQNAATYSHQLNVLLPAIVTLTNSPNIPDRIKDQLNCLRKLRNQIAHSGLIDPSLDKNTAARCLCAAFLAVSYLRGIRPGLQGKAE